MKKKIFIILIIVSLIISGVSYVLIGNNDKEDSEVVKYSYANVTEGDITIELMADGQVEIPIREYSFNLQGKVDSINVDLYQDVLANDILATLNIDELENELNEAKLSLENIILEKDINANEYNNKVIDYNFQLSNLENVYQVNKETFEDMKILSDAYPLNDIEKAERDFLNALSNYENYKLTNKPIGNIESDDIAIEKAKNAVEKLEYDIENSTIKALIDGKVIDINIIKNENISTSKVALKVEEGNKVYITTNLPEIDIQSVFIDQKAYIEVEAMLGKMLEAKVIKINRDPIIDNNGIVNYEVLLELSDENNEIMDGMTVTTTFVIMEKLNVIKIPNKAVKKVESKQIVTVSTGENTAKEVEIVTGLTDGRFVEVLSGLNIGDKLVYEE